jgi:hypothetical protein
MLTNATVNSWAQVTGTTGAGHPSRTALTLAHKIPCELVMPSAARRATERAAGIELSRVVLVEARALAPVAGLGDPAVGDQLTVALARRPDVLETLDLVEVRELPGEDGSVWECKCGQRLGGVTA